MLTIKTIDTKYHHIKVIINLIVKKAFDCETRHC